MGFRFRKSVGPKGLKLNIGKSGPSSASLKIFKGITYNSKRGLTLGIPGTGMSYNFGKKKYPTAQKTKPMSLEEKRVIREQSLERTRAKKAYNKGWKEFTGGYSNYAKISIAVSFGVCLTPLKSLGSYLFFVSLAWLIVDAALKRKKYDRHLKEANNLR
jgi:hypothetical protein